MDPHPDFADSPLPETLTLGGYTLSVLGIRDVAEDYAHVMDSADLLLPWDGSWPAGLTLEGNLVDLAWHQREFAARRSFAWVIRDGAGAYTGCAYVYPALGARGRGSAVFWFTRRAATTQAVAAFRAAFRTWLDKAVGDASRYPLTDPGAATG